MDVVAAGVTTLSHDYTLCNLRAVIYVLYMYVFE
jgi:hypothetical protein